jgi:hypothetical protein
MDKIRKRLQELERRTKPEEIPAMNTPELILHLPCNGRDGTTEDFRLACFGEFN